MLFPGCNHAVDEGFGVCNSIGVMFDCCQLLLLLRPPRKSSWPACVVLKISTSSPGPICWPSCALLSSIPAISAAMAKALCALLADPPCGLSKLRLVSAVAGCDATVSISVALARLAALLPSRCPPLLFAAAGSLPCPMPVTRRWPCFCCRVVASIGPRWRWLRVMLLSGCVTSLHFGA